MNTVEIIRKQIASRIENATEVIDNPLTAPSERRLWIARRIALQDALRDIDRTVDMADRPVHTVRGEQIGPEGVPYGTRHDMDCPGCQDTPFLVSPRSETYWAS